MALGVCFLGIGGGGDGGGCLVGVIVVGIGGGGGGKDGGNRQVGGLEAILRQSECDSALLCELDLMYCFGSSCISVCKCNVKLGLNSMVASASWFGKSRPR